MKMVYILDFELFAVFLMLWSFFWVIPRRLNFMCRRFGTHTQSVTSSQVLQAILPATPPMKIEQSVFRNVGT
jgi:hypothetical protein